MNRPIPIVLLLLILSFSSCDKKEKEEVAIPPNAETKKDPDLELLERQEFERLKKLEMGDSGTASSEADSLVSDTTSASGKTEKKSLVQKEKELNKRLDNPKVAVNDYLEFIQRGISEGGNFELNMKKASEQWEKSNTGRFTKNYKDTKKLIIVNEPKVVKQQGDEATVDVTIKKIDLKDGNEVETEMKVRYILAADSKGKWKIRDNKVTTK